MALPARHDASADPIVPFAIGPIYTVGLEMIFYLIAPLFVRCRLSILVAIFAIGAAVHFTPYWLAMPQREWQYEFFPGVFVFFVAGALSYRLYTAVKGTKWAHRIGYVAVPVIVGYIWLIDQNQFTAYVNDVLVYGLYLLLAALVPFLFVATKRSKADRFLGSVAYPLYVVHMPIIRIAAEQGWENADWIARGLSIIAAILLAFVIERPLENVRDVIRGDRRKDVPQSVCAQAIHRLLPTRPPVHR